MEVWTTKPPPIPIGLGPNEGQDVRVDDVRVTGHEAMWIPGIDFERSVLEQLGLK